MDQSWSYKTGEIRYDLALERLQDKLAGTAYISNLWDLGKSTIKNARECNIRGAVRNYVQFAMEAALIDEGLEHLQRPPLPEIKKSVQALEDDLIGILSLNCCYRPLRDVRQQSG